MIHQDSAFLLLAAGVFAMIYEFLRPGLILPGILGAGAALAGSFYLLTGSPRPYFLLAGVALAGLLFIMESVSRRPYMSGALASFSLMSAVARGCAVHLALAIPLCAAAGFTVTFLIRQTRVARLNKAM